jgi:hypothetical protein
MGHALAALFFLSFTGAARAQLFSTPFGGKATAVDRVLNDLAKLEVSDAGAADRYSTLVSEGERLLDAQRQQCLELSSNRGGQQCVRDVVGGQRKLLEAAHGAKRRLLVVIHERQLKQLDETREEAIKRLDQEF